MSDDYQYKGEYDNKPPMSDDKKSDIYADTVSYVNQHLGHGVLPYLRPHVAKLADAASQLTEATAQLNVCAESLAKEITAKCELRDQLEQTTARLGAAEGDARRLARLSSLSPGAERTLIDEYALLLRKYSPAPEAAKPAVRELRTPVTLQGSLVCVVCPESKNNGAIGHVVERDASSIEFEWRVSFLETERDDGDVWFRRDQLDFHPEPASPPSQAAGPERAWLIERQYGGAPEWAIVEHSESATRITRWTFVARQATRYETREQALDVLPLVTDDYPSLHVTVTEHLWQAPVVPTGDKAASPLEFSRARLVAAERVVEFARAARYSIATDAAVEKASAVMVAIQEYDELGSCHPEPPRADGPDVLTVLVAALRAVQTGISQQVAFHALADELERAQKGAS